MQERRMPPKTMSETLLEWYGKNARNLPWRKTPSPYHVLISEVMLQQTQVRTVIPFYLRWMTRFPDLKTLAKASEEDILKAWEGLGYYRRARALGQLARQVQMHHCGDIPGEEDTLLSLPGIGPYTAGAILSIAFNRPFPAVDGNVERVLTRLFDLDLPVDKAPGKREIRRRALTLIPEGQARHLNQSLMELGALVCLPKSPLCVSCPIVGHCLGLKRGTVALRPMKSPRPKTFTLFAGTVIIEGNGRYLLFRRPSTGLMAGLWEFPTITFSSLPESEEMRRETYSAFGLDLKELEILFSVRHSFTRYRVTVRAFHAKEFGGNPTPPDGWEAHWGKPEEIIGLPFSAGSRKIRDRVHSLLHIDTETGGEPRSSGR